MPGAAPREHNGAVTRQVPQPSLDRLTPFAGHPVVVGVTPGQDALVAATAANWAGALGVPLYAAYVDPLRVTIEEFADGTVRHAAVNPDEGDDDAWRVRERDLAAQLAPVLDAAGVTWELRYLAGRADRSLTHLARAVDAAAIVVGTRAPGVRSRVHEFVEGSVAVHLAHHQHRPVLVVPLAVVDWSQPVARG